MMTGEPVSCGRTEWRRRLLMLAIVGIFGQVVLSAVFAQPPPPEAVTPVGRNSDGMPGGDSADGDGETASEPHVRRLYVPASELDLLLKQDRHQVLLSGGEFRRLWNAAKRTEAEAVHDPADVVLSSANYAARVEGEHFLLTAEIDFTQFATGWHVLRIPVGGLNVEGVSLDGETASASRDTQQSDTLLVFNRSLGAHRLALELSARLLPVGSDRLAEFALSGAPSGVLTLSLPEEKSLSVDGLAVTKAAGEMTGDATGGEKGTRFRIPVGGRSRVSLRITDGEASQESDSLLFARTAYGLRAAPGEVTWTTRTTLTTYGRTLDQLTFTVPPMLDVAAVESNGLASWNMTEAERGDRTEITLTYRQPFTGMRDVTIRGVFVPDEDQWSMPTLLLSGADSQTASVLVLHDPGIRLQPEYDDSVRPALADETLADETLANEAGLSVFGTPVIEDRLSPEPERRTPNTERRYRMAFHAMRADFDLSFFTPRKRGVMQAAMTSLLRVSDHGLDLSVALDVQAAVAPLFEVRLTLPADFEVTGVAVAGQPSDWTFGTGDVGRIDVRIALQPPLAPDQTRRIGLWAHADPEDWPVEKNSVLLSFPQVGLPQADMTEARYGVTVDDDLDVRAVDLTGLNPARSDDAAGLRKHVEKLEGELRLGFTNQGEEITGELEITRRPATLSVSTLSLSRLEPERVVTQLRSTVTVDGGGIEGLLIELPESVAADARFVLSPMEARSGRSGNSGIGPSPSSAVVIIEQTVSDAISGRRTWALRFDRRMHGTHLLTARLTEPRTDDTAVALTAATFVGADRQNGWIAVEARDDQRLSVAAFDAAGRALRSVDPIDLPGMDTEDPSQRRIIAGYRFSRPGANATVTEARFERAAVPTAIADRFVVRSLLGPSGTLQHRLDVRFRAVGAQSLLMALPAESGLWAVKVDGRPIEVRQSLGRYQVPLPPADVPEAARSLQVFYASKSDDAQTGGRLQQAEPRLAIQLGNGETQPIDVLAHDWTLLYPRDVVLLESRGRLTPTQAFVDDTLIGRIVESIRVPSLDSLGWRVGIAAAVLVVLWLINVVRHAAAPSVLVLIGGVKLAGVLLVGLLFYEFAAQDQGSAEYFASSELSALPQAESLEQQAGARRGLQQGEGIGGGGFGGGGGANKLGRELRGGADQQFDFDGIGIDQDFNVPTDSPIPNMAQQESMPQSQGAAAPGEAASTPASELDGDEADGVAPVFGRPVLQDGELARVELAGVERAAAGGALLSLSLDLDAPQGLREMPFRSLGTAERTAVRTAGDVEAAAIDVRYASRSSREVMAWIVACGVMLVMWWMRGLSATTRGVTAVVTAVVTVILPVALVTVVPSLRSMIVEGVLLGGVAGVVLWGARAIVCWFAHSTSDIKTPHISAKQAAHAMIVIAGLIGGQTGCLAGEAADSRDDRSAAQPSESRADRPSDAGPGRRDDVPTVIIPYADGDPLASDRVLLPRKLFDELRAWTHPDGDAIGPAPVEGVIAEAMYAVEIGERARDPRDESGLSVTGRYVLHSFRSQPVALPLPLTNVAVTGATLDDVAAIIRPAGKGGLEIVVPKAGRHVLQVSFKLPAEIQPTSGDFVLPLLPVAAGRLTVTLPARDDWAISVLRDGRTPIGYRRQQAAGGVTVEVPIDRGGKVSVSWRPEQSSNGRLGIVNVESTTAIQIDDAGAGLRAAYDVEVRQGSVSRMVFGFPEPLRLKRLSGTDVGGWQLSVDGDERTLTVFLRRTVEDRTRIVADLYIAETGSTDELSFDIPAFAPRQVTRESGQVVLLANEERDVRTAATDGAVRTNELSGPLPDELNPQSLPSRGTFRFTSRPWRLSVTTALRPPQVRSKSEHGMFLGRRRILLGSRLRFDLTGAPRRLLRVLLPQDFELVDLQSGEVREWFVEEGELVLDLGEPRVGAVTVTFEGHMQRFENDIEAVLETPLPQDVERQESRLAVWVEEGLTATLDSFEGWRPLAPDELSDELRSLHSLPPQFAFRSTELEPELILLQMQRAQARLVGDAVTLIAVSDTSVDYGLTLRWTIERAATDLLTFTTPDWLAGRLEFTGEGIARTSAEFLDDGRVRWSVSLEDGVRGQYLLSAIATLPPPAEGTVSAPEIRFERPAAETDEFSAVAVQRSFAVLVNLSAAQLSPADGEAHEEVRAEDLPLTLRSELLAQAMEVAEVPIDGTVTWQMQSVIEQRQATATVTSADLTTVLAADGSWRTDAAYRVRNRGHQFLAVRVPADARLLSVLVKDRPARVLRTELNEKPAALVPLPQTSAADLSFVVRLVLQGTLPRPFSQTVSVRGDRVSLPVPSVVTPRESIEYGVPVVHTNWTVAVPDEFDASPVTEGTATNVSFHPEGTSGVLPYLRQLQELSDLNLQVTDNSLSMSQRKRAAGNIRELGEQLQFSADRYEQERSGKSPTVVPNEFEKLGEQREQLLFESLHNADKLGGVISGESGNETPLPDAAGDSRQYILGNTIAIQQDNRGSGVNRATPEIGSEFRFDTPARASEESGGLEGRASGRKPGQSRSMLKERLSRQKSLNAPAKSTPQSGEILDVESLVADAARATFFVDPRTNIVGRDHWGDGTVAGMVDPTSLGLIEAEIVQHAVTNFADEDAGPAHTGGLSLPIEIPVDGNRLTFSKLGGGPALTLALRPRESVEQGLRWLWTVVGCGLAVVVLRLLIVGRLNWTPVIATGAILIGLFTLLLLPTPVAWFGLPLILIGGATWLRTRTARLEPTGASRAV